MPRAGCPSPDFVTDPDAVVGPEWSLSVAAGGLIGLAERTEWLQRTKFVWP